MKKSFATMLVSAFFAVNAYIAQPVLAAPETGDNTMIFAPGQIIELMPGDHYTIDNPSLIQESKEGEKIIITCVSCGEANLTLTNANGESCDIKLVIKPMVIEDNTNKERTSNKNQERELQRRHIDSPETDYDIRTICGVGTVYSFPGYNVKFEVSNPSIVNIDDEKGELYFHSTGDCHVKIRFYKGDTFVQEASVYSHVTEANVITVPDKSVYGEDYIAEFMSYINEARINLGRKPLQVSQELCLMADKRAEKTADRDEYQMVTSLGGAIKEISVLSDNDDIEGIYTYISNKENLLAILTSHETETLGIGYFSSSAGISSREKRAFTILLK